MTKERLRQEFLARRLAIPKHRILSCAIALRKELAHRGNILSFYPIGSEIDLSLLNHSLQEKGCLYLPRMEEGRLVPYLFSAKDRLVLSRWKIPEPDPQWARKGNMSQIDLILVPGLAFDAQKQRLGYGKGIYDRFLATCPRVASLGVGFKEQLSSEALPTDPWDVPVGGLMLL